MRKKSPVNLLVAVLVICSSFTLFSCVQSDDAKIGENVKAGTSVINPNIQVAVQKGVVTLSGEVKDSASRSAAENSIKEIKGVKSVVNSIQVK